MAIEKGLYAAPEGIESEEMEEGLEGEMMEEETKPATGGMGLMSRGV